MATELPKTCFLCGKRLRYANGNKRAQEQGLPVGARTHDHDAKSEAHFGHIGGDRSRDEFAKLPKRVWTRMGVLNPRDSRILCFECHEVILHNPVLSESQLERLAKAFRGKSFAQRVIVFNRIIEYGLIHLEEQESRGK